jgi:CheY-like chemotaxis protein
MMKNALQVRGRQHVRAAVDGGAYITVDGKRMIGPYLIENLSVGGALLIGSSAPALNTIVDVELRLSGLEPIRVAGVVARLYEAATGSSCFAIEFRGVPADVEDDIQGVVLVALKKAREAAGPTALVVDRSYADRAALALDLAPLVSSVVIADTPLLALQRLQDPRLPISVALVSLHSLPLSGIDVLAFIAKSFPTVRRVLVSLESDAEFSRSAAAARVAQAVLMQPWDRRSLASAVGIPTGA